MSSAGSPVCLARNSASTSFIRDEDCAKIDCPPPTFMLNTTCPAWHGVTRGRASAWFADDQRDVAIGVALVAGIALVHLDDQGPEFGLLLGCRGSGMHRHSPVVDRDLD